MSVQCTLILFERYTYFQIFYVPVSCWWYALKVYGNEK
jgi:hypothetical protein